MTRCKFTSRQLAGTLACALSLAAAAPSAAEVFHSEPVRHRVIYVPRDKSAAFRLDGPASKIVVSQPDTADVVATTDHSFYIQGRQLGATNLLVYGLGGQLHEVIDVRVGYDSQGLQDDLAAAFPREPIRVRTLGQTLLLTGEVSDTGIAARALAMALQYAPNAVTSNLTVRASQEVVLEVRVLEADRSITHDIGVSGKISNGSFSFAWGSGLIGTNTPTGLLTLTGGAGHTTIDTQLAALEARNIVRTLARPNLVAVSGEKASFLAGGEFPYPVPQVGAAGSAATVTLEFREYGVKLDFKPTVEDNGFIRLEVSPEVSQLDFSNSLRVDGFTVPGLITRKTNTTVELRNGDFLAIGGLYQRNFQTQVSQVPGLGKVPVLGALFRSAEYQKGETELLIIVTPRLVNQGDVAAARNVQMLPGREVSEHDLFLKGEDLDKPIQPDPNAPPAPEPAAKPASHP